MLDEFPWFLKRSTGGTLSTPPLREGRRAASHGDLRPDCGWSAAGSTAVLPRSHPRWAPSPTLWAISGFQAVGAVDEGRGGGWEAQRPQYASMIAMLVSAHDTGRVEQLSLWEGKTTCLLLRGGAADTLFLPCVRESRRCRGSG